MDVVHEVSEFHEVLSEHENKHESTRSVTVTVTWTRRASASVSSVGKGESRYECAFPGLCPWVSRPNSWSELG